VIVSEAILNFNALFLEASLRCIVCNCFQTCVTLLESASLRISVMNIRDFSLSVVPSLYIVLPIVPALPVAFVAPLKSTKTFPFVI
jgi:hypothetical protein